MTPWKAIVAAVLIFLAGTASGALATLLYRAQTPRPHSAAMHGGPPSAWMGQRLELMRRLGDRLHLTPDQQSQIDRLVTETQQRLRELWDPVAPKAQEEMRGLRERIAGLLSPEQRNDFEKLLKERPPKPGGEHPNWRRRAGAARNAEGSPPSAPPAKPPPRDSVPQPTAPSPPRTQN